MEENHTYLIQEYGRDIARALLPIDILLSVVLVAGIIGNTFVIFIFATKMRKDKKASRYFIPILAFWDLMVCIMSEIRFISNSQHWSSFHSDELCKTLMFFLVQTIMTSDAFILAIAVQRFIKICRPTATQMTLYWRRVTVVLVIVTNTLYSIPHAVISGVQETSAVYRNVNIIGEGCATANNQYPLFQMISYCMLMFILVANIGTTFGLYVPIGCVIYRRFRKRRIQQRPRSDLPPNDKNKPSKTKFNLMFLVIISAYAVAYLPTAVMISYVTLDDTLWATSSNVEFRSYVFLFRTYVFNHAVNPFVYAYFDSEIRSHMICSFHRSSNTYVL